MPAGLFFLSSARSRKNWINLLSRLAFDLGKIQSLRTAPCAQKNRLFCDILHIAGRPNGHTVKFTKPNLLKLVRWRVP
jgi:hypothetical protein